MPNALIRYTPELLPVPHGRIEPLPVRQPATADKRSEEFRAEPPRTEVRFSSRFGKSGGTTHESSDASHRSAGQASFTAQQIAESDTSSTLQLTSRKPLVAGYAAYATAARHGDPNQPRKGQMLDKSI